MRLKAIYTWRGLLAALPVIFSIFCFLGECEDDLVVWPLGLLLFGLGWALRMWAQKYLGYRLRIKRSITSSGPYALVRNPIYIGNTLVILGGSHHGRSLVDDSCGPALVWNGVFLRGVL
jgi:protein-S-isoprenylcysteine O-methyltransferase Ste14